jgi:hypothetical protein
MKWAGATTKRVDNQADQKTLGFETPAERFGQCVASID